MCNCDLVVCKYEIFGVNFLGFLCFYSTIVRRHNFPDVGNLYCKHSLSLQFGGSSHENHTLFCDKFY